MKKSSMTALTLAGNAAVTEASYSSKAFCFRNSKGVFFRLSFSGISGWRLQTSKNGQFDDLGAVQALARFLKEPIPAKTEKITVSAENGAIVIREKKGTHAVLSLGDSFSLTLCTAAGKTISAITDVCYEDANMAIVTGTLAEGEAIYGGGERLDVVNKRGTAFHLFTCDGWNNSSTTYVVIPLFLTTRGGGMFFNRNEFAKVDFGKTVANEWTYAVQYADIDCYFYPTGNMADALRGYTELAGHATMPSAWMHGMHICRYGPDNWNFDQDKTIASVEEIPEWEELYVVADGKYTDIVVHNLGDALTGVVNGGESYVLYKDIPDEAKAQIDRFYLYNAETQAYEMKYVRNDAGEYFPKGRKGNPGGLSTKTILSRFIADDMKPAGAILEGRGWANGFVDSDKGRENKEDLKRCVAWLHAHGMKAMVYIRVGGIFAETIGFQPAYNVHADVRITNPDGSVTVEENTPIIPWVRGTGAHPDIIRMGNGKLKALPHFDITNDEAIAWYFDTIWEELIDIGIDGAKIDFCEIMPDGEVQFGDGFVHYRWKNPERIVPRTEHHAHPTYFISLFCKKMMEKKEKRGLKDSFMAFSRGGGIGSQRNPYLWSGDQARDFDKLDDQLLAVVNSGLSGIPFMSFDMAGYAYCGNNYFTIGKEKESSIFARAVEFTAFLTQMQTHGDVRHAYEMTEEVKQIYRNFTRLHTDLIPYMQKYSKIACETGMPPVRHLVLQYPTDTNVYDRLDEFLLGEGLLVAPILTRDTYEREVYLPAGEWTDLLTGEVIEGGKSVVAKVNLGQIPVYLNNRSADKEELLPIFEGQNWAQIKHFTC